MKEITAATERGMTIELGENGKIQIDGNRDTPEALAAIEYIRQHRQQVIDWLQPDVIHCDANKLYETLHWTKPPMDLLIQLDQTETLPPAWRQWVDQWLNLLGVDPHQVDNYQDNQPATITRPLGDTRSDDELKQAAAWQQMKLVAMSTTNNMEIYR